MQRIIKKITETTVQKCAKQLSFMTAFFSAYRCSQAKSATCFGFVGFKVKGLQETHTIFISFFYFYLKNVREVFMVTTVLKHVRFRTLDIAVCQGGALVPVIPVTFHHRYVPRRQVRRNETQRENTYFNRNFTGLSNRSLKRTPFEVFFYALPETSKKLRLKENKLSKQTRYPSNKYLLRYEYLYLA